MSRAHATAVTKSLLRRWKPPTLDGLHGKEERGTVLVVGGSERNPGAVLLAGLGALRAGAGRLQIATARQVAGALSVAVPEARVTPLPTRRDGELGRRLDARVLRDAARCDTLLVGPGMTSARAASVLLRHAEGLAVLDSAAIHALEGAPRRGRPAHTIITPHAGELAALLDVERDEVIEKPLELARRTAQMHDVIVVLKGPRTFVVAPSGEAFVSTSGNLGLGTSGSGDTLAGMIAGLGARGAAPMQAAVIGVFAHGLAGENLAGRIAPLGYLASELLIEVPGVLASLGAC